MTEEEKALWEKIKEFNLDYTTVEFNFSKRLARENGWTIHYTKAVILEYKRFLFLCCIHKNGVTPSDQVDQVWHLHMIYTKSYWIDLCKNTLGKEIHHNPTNGGRKEGEKFNNYYSGTLALYQNKFGEYPPENIWPDNQLRFTDVKFQRVNLKKYWIIRKPRLTSKNSLLLIGLFSMLFFIQSSKSKSFEEALTLVIVILLFLPIVFKGGKGNNSGGSSGGCSTSGCHGHSGCSGDSGCSGCGSGCGGD